MIIKTRFRPWQTRTHCCGHIVAHDVSCAAQTGKHLLRTQNVSEQNQKHFLRPATNVARACKRGNICVGNNVSSFARAFQSRVAKIRRRSIYQYSGQTSIFGVVFFVSKFLLGIERQKKLLNLAISEPC